MMEVRPQKISAKKFNCKLSQNKKWYRTLIASPATTDTHVHTKTMVAIH